MAEMDSKHSMDTRYPIENGFSGDKAKSKELSNRQQLISFCSASIDNLNHMMAAVVTFYGMAYAVRDRNNISYNQAHIILTVVGYQMLMVESILIFRTNNGPAKDLNRNNRKLIHWILQLVGSVFAIAGSALQVYDRGARLFTIHGITGFASMIITVLALITSIPALYSQELRSAIKPNLSKFCHILFGLGSFVVGMVSLCYGMDKTGFKNWTSVGVAGWLIAFCAFTTIYATIMPLFNMFDRLRKSF